MSLEYSKIIKAPNPETDLGKLIYEHLEGKAVLIQQASDGSYVDFWDHCGDRHPQDALMLQSLFAVNRYEDAARVRRMLAEGAHVIQDRYFTSSEVYGAVDGLDRDWLRRVNDSLPEPDLVIFLDIELSESIRRRPERRDRFEANAEFLERVRAEYTEHFLARSREGRAYVIIDGQGSPEEVRARIWSMVKTVLTDGRRMDGGPIL